VKKDVHDHQHDRRNAEQPRDHIFAHFPVSYFLCPHHTTNLETQLAYHSIRGGSSYIAMPKVYKKTVPSLARKPLKLLQKCCWHAACDEDHRIGARTRASHVHILFKEKQMNWDRIEGNWKQIKGKAKQQWGKLTDDQLDVIAGKRDLLAGKIQEEYGISKDETEKQLSDFERRYRDWDPRS
jgi:uncharacterized protein YjbJ (UPF0337 family)